MTTRKDVTRTRKGSGRQLVDRTVLSTNKACSVVKRRLPHILLHSVYQPQSVEKYFEKIAFMDVVL